MSLQCHGRVDGSRNEKKKKKKRDQDPFITFTRELDRFGICVRGSECCLIKAEFSLGKKWREYGSFVSSMK